MIAAKLALLHMLTIAAMNTPTVHLRRALRGARGDGAGQRHDGAHARGIALAASLATSLKQMAAQTLAARDAIFVARLLARHVQHEDMQVAAGVDGTPLASLLAVSTKTSAAGILAREGSLQVALESARALVVNAANRHAPLSAAQGARARAHPLQICVTSVLAPQTSTASGLVLAETIASIGRNVSAHGQALRRRHILALLRVMSVVPNSARSNALSGNGRSAVGFASSNFRKAVVSHRI